MISLNKDICYKKTEWEPLTDVTIPRCPSISSFHFSLDRVFGSHYEFSGETHELSFTVRVFVPVSDPCECWTVL